MVKIVKIVYGPGHSVAGAEANRFKGLQLVVEIKTILFFPDTGSRR